MINISLSSSFIETITIEIYKAPRNAEWQAESYKVNFKAANLSSGISV